MERNDENILNMQSMPWLDIGDLPTTYTPKKAEGWQVFMNPQSKVPHSLVVEYREWNKQYDCSRAKSVYDQFLFETKGITMSDIEETLRQATLFVKPYLGRFAMIDKIKNIVLGVSFALFLCASIATGMASESYGAAAGVMIFYILACFGAFWAVRFVSHKLFRNSQFALAMLCRAENNRFYLHNGVELRPGYLGRWIEFRMLDQVNQSDILAYFRTRFLKPQ